MAKNKKAPEQLSADEYAANELQSGKYLDKQGKRWGSPSEATMTRQEVDSLARSQQRAANKAMKDAKASNYELYKYMNPDAPMDPYLEAQAQQMAADAEWQRLAKEQPEQFKQLYDALKEEGYTRSVVAEPMNISPQMAGRNSAAREIARPREVESSRADANKVYVAPEEQGYYIDGQGNKVFTTNPQGKQAVAMDNLRNKIIDNTVPDGITNNAYEFGKPEGSINSKYVNDYVPKSSHMNGSGLGYDNQGGHMLVQPDAKWGGGVGNSLGSQVYNSDAFSGYTKMPDSIYGTAPDIHQVYPSPWRIGYKKTQAFENGNMKVPTDSVINPDIYRGKILPEGWGSYNYAPLERGVAINNRMGNNMELVEEARADGERGFAAQNYDQVGRKASPELSKAFAEKARADGYVPSSSYRQAMSQMKGAPSNSKFAPLTPQSIYDAMPQTQIEVRTAEKPKPETWLSRDDLEGKPVYAEFLTDKIGDPNKKYRTVPSFIMSSAAEEYGQGSEYPMTKQQAVQERAKTNELNRNFDDFATGESMVPQNYDQTGRRANPDTANKLSKGVKDTGRMNTRNFLNWEKDFKNNFQGVEEANYATKPTEIKLDPQLEQSYGDKQFYDSTPNAKANRAQLNAFRNQGQRAMPYDFSQLLGDTEINNAFIDSILEQPKDYKNTGMSAEEMLKQVRRAKPMQDVAMEGYSKGNGVRPTVSSEGMRYQNNGGKKAPYFNPASFGALAPAASAANYAIQNPTQAGVAGAVGLAGIAASNLINQGMDAGMAYEAVNRMVNDAKAFMANGYSEDVAMYFSGLADVIGQQRLEEGID